MNIFIWDLYMLFNVCCPEVSLKPIYKYRKPWLCPILLKFIIKKNELYKNYLQNTNSETNYNLSTIYKNYKNILTSVLRKAEALHYSNDKDRPKEICLTLIKFMKLMNNCSTYTTESNL